MKLSHLFALGISTFSAQSALSCASCGSGGLDLINMYPQERIKTVLSLKNSSGFKTISSQGEEYSKDGDLTGQTDLVLGVGFRTTKRSFLSVVAPLRTNVVDGDTETKLGDIDINGRYTILRQNAVFPWVPQVQLLAGYHFDNSDSIINNTAQESVDSFGTGYEQLRLGFDLWLAQFEWKLGFAYNALVPTESATSQNGTNVKKGMGDSFTLTAGYGGLKNKVLVGNTTNFRRADTSGGEEVKVSRTLSNSQFLTADWAFSDVDMLRFTATVSGQFFRNYTTSKNYSFSLTWLHSFVF